MKWMNAEETLRRAEAPLFWVGAFTVASLALWLLYRLLSGFRIWVLGNGKLLSPKLGKWAGESGHISFHGHEEGATEAGRCWNEVTGLKLHFGTKRSCSLLRFALIQGGCCCVTSAGQQLFD